MTTTTNKRVRFCDNNLGELSTEGITYSSELSSFPGSNTVNKFRSKAWKPSGNFVITLDVNDKLYINDGSDKTITITPGNYSTPALLASQVETDLNNLSSGWSFDYNNTLGNYKFRFLNASSFTLRFSETTESIWNDVGFMLSNDEVITTERIADEQRNHMYESVVYDLGYNAPIEFFSVISPLDEEFSISDNATIKLQANNLNDFTSPPLEITLERDGAGVYRFLDDIEDSSYRFWRFYFDDKTNINGPEGFSISYIYLGDFTTLSGTNVQIGLGKEINDPSLKTESEAGAIYFDKKTKFTKISGAKIALLDTESRDILEQLFFDFGTTTPFFISLDPKQDISNSLSDLTKYVVFEKSPMFTHVQSQYFNMSLSFREVL